MRNHVRGICDRCGFEWALNDLRKEWNGLKTCPECFDKRHPQEFQRVRSADRAPYDKRVVGEVNYLEVNDVTADDL